MVLGVEELTVASIRCRRETVKTCRVFISGSYVCEGLGGVSVILGDLTFLCGCGSLRAKITRSQHIKKGLNDTNKYQELKPLQILINRAKIISLIKKRLFHTFLTILR
jgi:hypothetical protein